MNDTICAISTPAGVGGIAVVRVSGPDAFAIVGRIWKGRDLAAVGTHTAHLGYVTAADGSLLDQCVATVFIGPNTFTGEDVVEISVHGSTYIQQQLVGSLVAAGARIAEPGEFTRRAFANGRLDLAEAEGVGELIAASSRAAHNLAIAQLKGRLSGEIDELRNSLIHIASMLELELDFSEEDVSFADRGQLRQLATTICSKVDKMASTFAKGDALRNGVSVAIVGKPNVGKSCLLNTLLDYERAIVSDIPGTTRDTVEDTLDIDGVTFRFIDTAGLRATDDPIEQLGIDRTISTAKAAHVILWLTTPDEVAAEDFAVPGQIASTEAKVIAIINKIDLCTDIESAVKSLQTKVPQTFEVLPISAKNNLHIDRLRQAIVRDFNIDTEGENMIVASLRHYQELQQAAENLHRVITGLDQNQYTDLIAQDLRQAIHHLSAITGAITTETLLTSIFQNFCIGK